MGRYYFCTGGADIYKAATVAAWGDGGVIFFVNSVPVTVVLLSG